LLASSACHELWLLWLLKMDGNIAVAIALLPMLFWGMLPEGLQVQGCCCEKCCGMWHDAAANLNQDQAFICGPVVLLWLQLL